MAAHASPAGDHAHPAHDHHQHHEGHASAAAKPVSVLSALTMSAVARLIVAGSLAAVLWLLVLWAMV